MSDEHHIDPGAGPTADVPGITVQKHTPAMNPVLDPNRPLPNSITQEPTPPDNLANNLKFLKGRYEE